MEDDEQEEPDPVKDFGSPAEDRAYPMILEVGKEKGYKVVRQHPIWDTRFRRWVSEKYGAHVPDWVRRHNCDDHEGDYVDCTVCERTILYRLDFALLKGSLRYGIKYDIEIDGEKYHSYQVGVRTFRSEDDFQRDLYLKCKGWIVIRIAATTVFRTPHAMLETLRKAL